MNVPNAKTEEKPAAKASDPRSYEIQLVDFIQPVRFGQGASYSRLVVNDTTNESTRRMEFLARDQVLRVTFGNGFEVLIPASSISTMQLANDVSRAKFAKGTVVQVKPADPPPPPKPVKDDTVKL